MSMRKLVLPTLNVPEEILPEQVISTNQYGSIFVYSTRDGNRRFRTSDILVKYGDQTKVVEYSIDVRLADVKEGTAKVGGKLAITEG